MYLLLLLSIRSWGSVHFRTRSSFILTAADLPSPPLAPCGLCEDLLPGATLCVTTHLSERKGVNTAVVSHPETVQLVF